MYTIDYDFSITFWIKLDSSAIVNPSNILEISMNIERDSKK